MAISGTAHDYTVSAFPFIETFDNEELPLGWLNVVISGAINEKWTRETIGTYPDCSPFGTAMLRYNSFSISADKQAMLVTRRLDMNTGTYGVGFKMYRNKESWGTYRDKVDVYVNTQPNITGATHLGTIHRKADYEPVVSADGWYDYQYQIPDTYITNKSYIILLATSKNGYNIFVDELVVKGMSMVTLEDNPAGGGTLTGGGGYFPGTQAVISATPNEGYEFLNWTNSIGYVVSTTATFNYTVGESNVTLTANFVETNDVNFAVTDQGSNALQGVSIAYSGTLSAYPTITIEGTVTTNVSGEAVVSLPNGTYDFTFTKNDYYTVTQNGVDVNSDQNINQQMQIYPLITFNVEYEDENPVVGAAINLVGYPTLTTDASGVATKRLPQETYTGEIFKIGYNIENVNFTLTDDTDRSFNFTLTEALPTFAYTDDWSEGAVFKKSLINVESAELTFTFTNIGSDTLFVNKDDFTITGHAFFTFTEDYSGKIDTLTTGSTAMLG